MHQYICDIQTRGALVAVRDALKFAVLRFLDDALLRAGPANNEGHIEGNIQPQWEGP